MIRSSRKMYLRSQQITVRVIGHAQRKAELEQLARCRMRGQASTFAEKVMLSALVRDGLHGAALAGAWESYLEAIQLREALENGHAIWAELMPELAGDDRPEQAISIAEQEEQAAALAILGSCTQLAGSSDTGAEGTSA